MVTGGVPLISISPNTRKGSPHHLDQETKFLSFTNPVVQIHLKSNRNSKKTIYEWSSPRGKKSSTKVEIQTEYYPKVEDPNQLVDTFLKIENI
jgi:hypothetical protein